MDNIEEIEQVRFVAEENLNKAHIEYSQPFTSGEHHKFYLLKVQAALIQFELSSEMVKYCKTKWPSFASKVALKDMLHKIFEYKKTLKNHHINTINELADSKCLGDEKTKLSKISKQYRTAINKIDQYKPLRNVAGGHYDRDISKQLSCIESIVEDEAIKIIKDFLSYNKKVLELFRDIGLKL